MIIVQAKVRCDHPDCLESAKIEIRFKGNDSNPLHKTWDLHNKPEGWHIDMSAPYYKSGKQYCPQHQPVKKPATKKKRTDKPKKETDQQSIPIEPSKDECDDLDIPIEIEDIEFLKGDNTDA